MKYNESLPDFKELKDRMIAAPSSSPTLVIKTNVDPQDATEENPYYSNSSIDEEEHFRNFFHEES
ncbi:hypothetical protein Q73_02870 [Bacillus coahuilensis m2-6]|uniref:Uncharacterized protein n=1 Tax=Bacillus coahuilensis p1.1.43 TaxID=1150625 RepID=A0A147KB58_9BACI|nr:hypothetical protein [Bacillus coahuilensis]KUP08121.1 hypothetical protein Q75_03430 [Bacillus coahuilensis p1.1.43]KUP09570.1 hypothetical protein Q73_02870 [Bacillus coahuilensis m2-6]